MLKVIGGEQEGEFKAVASGTLPNGKPVVVNADGTVSVVSETSVTEAVGTAVTYDATTAGENEVVYDSNAQKIVVTYRDTADSNRGHAVVGTVNASNNSISFGTPVQFTSTNVEWSDATYDSVNNKVVIAYANSQGSRYGYAIVGDVSGTSITFGSETVFNAYEVQHVSIGFDEGAGKVVIAYEDWGNSNYGTAIVGTVSGTSISFGSEVVYESARSQHPQIVYDSDAQKTVICFSTYGDSEHGYGIVGTVSGTSISFGSKTKFESAVVSDMAIAYDSNASKVVVAYRDAGNSNYGTAAVGTVSGTSISFGTPVVWNSAAHNHTGAAYDANVKKILITYRDNGNSNYGTVVSGTVSGTSISFDSEFVFNNSNSGQTGVGYDASSKKAVIAYLDNSTTSGDAVVYQAGGSVPNLTAENYIGMSRGVVVAGETGAKTTFDSNTLGNEITGSVYDPDTQKIIICYTYSASPYYGYAVVGTVSGTTLTFGTPAVFQSGETSWTGITYDTTNNKVVVVSRNASNSYYGMAAVGTVSGTSISFGTPVVYNSANSEFNKAVFDENAGKVVVTYRDNTNADGEARVGTVSGTSISFGTPATFDSGNANYIAPVYDVNAQKVVIAYRDNNDNNYGKALVATVSGTSLSFGTAATFSASSTEDTNIAYDSTNNKVIVAFKDGGDSDKGKAVLGTVSGTSISFGTVATINNASTSNPRVVYDVSKQKAVFFYATGGAYYVTASISGTDLTDISSSFTLDTSTVGVTNFVYHPDEEVSIAGFKQTGGQAIAFSLENRGSVADTNPASIDIIGSVSTNQSGEPQYLLQS